MSKSNTLIEQGNPNSMNNMYAKAKPCSPCFKSEASLKNKKLYVVSSHTVKTQIERLSECVPWKHCLEWAGKQHEAQILEACLLFDEGYLC